MQIFKFIKPIYVVFFVLILMIIGTICVFTYFNGTVDSKIDYSSYTSSDTTTEASTIKADSEFTSSSARMEQNYFTLENGSLFGSSEKSSKTKIADGILEINGINDKWIYVTTVATDTLKSYLIRLSFDGKTRDVIVMGVESGSIYNDKVDTVYFTTSKKRPIIVSSLKIITIEQRIIFRDYGIRIAGLLVFANDMTSSIENDRVVLKLNYKSVTGKVYYRRLVLNDTGTVFSDKTSVD